MWRSLAAVPDNPYVQDDDDTAPFDPKDPGTPGDGAVKPPSVL
jgi:hypothetical protein